MRVGSHKPACRVEGIMAIGGYGPPASTQVEVARGSIGGHRPIGIDAQDLRDLVPERYGEHVGRVIGMRSRTEVGSGNPPGGVIVESLCCPGSPGVRNACAQPMCKLVARVSC